MAAQRDELEMAPDEAEAWPDRIYDLLKEHGIRQVALVPDAGHSRLIRRCLADPGMTHHHPHHRGRGHRPLFGAFLGGEKGVLYAVQRRRQLHQHAVGPVAHPRRCRCS